MKMMMIMMTMMMMMMMGGGAIDWGGVMDEIFEKQTVKSK
jgi:hypothetical protein